MCVFFFSSRRRHTRFDCDWSSDVCSSDLGAPVGVDQDDGIGSPALRLVNQHTPHVGIALTRDERDAGLRDARLLPRDRREIGAQVIGMPASDLGDDGDEGGNDVSRVEPPPQTHLDHADVHAPRRQLGKGDRGGGLEEPRVQALDVGLQRAGPIGEGFFGDEHAFPGHTLAHRDQVWRGVEPHPQAAGAEFRRHERARRALAVRAGDVDAWKAALGMAQHAQEPLGWPEAPFDAAPLSREEKAAGVLEGQPAQSAASAGRRPPMWRSNWAVVSRSSLRGTTASTTPCSSRNSAVWNPGGRSCPMVCLITRGPANPITAPGSARITSPRIPYDADTPPVVGFVRIETKGIRAERSRAISTEVLAICISESTPSCMRAPPDAETMMRGTCFSAERRVRRAIFSPTTDPIEPPMKLKSITARSMGMPSRAPEPQPRAPTGAPGPGGLPLAFPRMGFHFQLEKDNSETQSP